MAKTTYREYQTESILNIQKHIDGGWFWHKYSAFPYLGCEWGCSYCYCRDEKYNPHKVSRDPEAAKFSDPFSQYIKIKKNTPEILKKQLQAQPKEVIYLDSYQPIEKKYRYIRRMLEVCHQLNFPVFINEKSPLLLQDLDILKKINSQTDLNVGWSIIFSADTQAKTTFEPNSPPIKARFKAMQKLAEQNILTGTVLMPILPLICDQEKNIQRIFKKTKQAGGKYVLDGGLTLWGYCGKFFYQYLKKYNSKLLSKYEEIYNNKSILAKSQAKAHRLVLKYAKHYQLATAIPRPISFYPKNLQVNKKVAEKLYLKARELQVSGRSGYREWAFRKAAWSVDELTENIKEIYQQKGKKGLMEIKNIGEKMGQEIKKQLI